MYRKIGLHPGIPENFHKFREVLHSTHGQDARAFGLPVARIMSAHIVTFDLHEL